MTPTSNLIDALRAEAESLGFPVRFMIQDACDRLERKSRDNKLLMQMIAELRKRTVKTNADRIRAMSDEELAELLTDNDYSWVTSVGRQSVYERYADWLKQPVKDGEE